MTNRSKPTIRDVARSAEVSVPTVSRVLNGRYGVAPETAARVRRAIEELGYESSLAARSMRSAQTNVIALIVPDMDHSYAIEVIKGISRAITGTHYDLLALTTGRKSAFERGLWEQQQVTRLSGSIADGVIVAVPDAERFRTDYPLVAVDPYRASTEYPAVIAANREGALAAMGHLLELGHRRIGFVTGSDYLQSAVRRRQGYEDGLRAHGIELDPTLVAASDFTREGGYAAGRQLLDQANPPTAIFAANDDSAFGVMDAARAAGLAIPADLAIVGFDNVPEAALAVPPLTTVDQSIMEMGHVAVEMLVKMIEGEALPNRLVRVPTRLVVRDSCAPPLRSV